MATHYRTCPFCEATCGLEIETNGREVVSVRGDADDVFSQGFICPKAYGIKQLNEDLDRLTTPLIRRNGELVEASWDEAFEEIDRRLSPVIAEHGKHAVAVYLGNPNAHNLSAIKHAPAWLRVLGTHNLYSASTVDQMPKQVSSGIEAAEIRRMARELAAAERAAVYARIGTCTQEFGTHASWLVDVLNVLTGNLDREGGVLFPRAAVGQKNSSGAGAGGRGVRFGRWTSRVRELPEYYGELPVAVIAEEIDTSGEGQVRALITAAGNPIVSTPNSGRLERAVEGLDFMLSIDIYVNETTRHADVILPAPEPLEKSHYDAALYQLSTPNIANYSQAVFERQGPAEWEIYMRLAGIIAGQGPNGDVRAFDDMVIQTLVQREVGMEGSRVEGREPAELLEALEPRRGPERVL